MDMPYHLKTLPPEALDILRFFHTLNSASAHADDIIEGTALSDRGFGKAIRRLVTKNYLVMDGDQVYRLSDMGRRAVNELSGYDDSAPESYSEYSATEDYGEEDFVTEPRDVLRHLVVVAPRALRPEQPTNIAVGFDASDDSDSSPIDLVVRVNVLHGEPQQAHEKSLILSGQAAHQTFEITAGNYQRARLRVQVSQYQTDTLDLQPVGGLYVDLPVETSPADTSFTAYGTDLTLQTQVYTAPEPADDFDNFDFGDL